MTILLISHTSELNGAERSLLDLAIGLKLQKIECLVLCPGPGKLSEKLEAQEIPVSFLNLPRPQSDLLNLAKFIVLWLPTVINLFYFFRKKSGIKVIYNNTVDGLYGPFACWLAKIPCVWHVREVKPKSSRVRRVFARIFIHFSAITVFNSKDTMSAYSKKSYPNWRVVYNGIEVDTQRPAISNRNKSTVVVGFAAQMVTFKRPELFISAFTIANKAEPSLAGTMAGDGVMLNEMRLLVEKQGVSKNLQILGRVNDMGSFYRGLDIFVLTSERESFGRVLIEAMSVGCPVIAANVGGVSEVVQDGVTGFLISSSDINAFAEKILLLTRDRDLRIQMGLAGYKRVQELFSITQYRNQLISVFSEVSKSGL